MATSWKCRLGLHRFVRRDSQGDPNEEVCVRCRKHRTRGASWFGGPWI